MKILTVQQMQKAEQECSRFNISVSMLMENAGKAVAEEVREILSGLPPQNILVLVGPGNNGGDGLVAARHLHDWGTGRVMVYLTGKRPEEDPNLAELTRRNLEIAGADNDPGLNKFNAWLSEATAVLDSIFGTGTSRPLSGIFSQILSSVNAAKKQRPELRLIAVDLPSGLNADTGAVDPATPTVDNTITLGFPKIGLFNLPGMEKIGKLKVVDIGIPPQLVDYVNIELFQESNVRPLLPKRPPVSHKGTFGKVLAFTGSINYIGAAYLACAGTLRTGAGLTTLAIARSLQPAVAARIAEVTYLPLPETEPGLISPESLDLLRRQLPQSGVFLMGCGIGQSQPVKKLVEGLLIPPPSGLPPVVLDADGINILSGVPDWWNHFTGEAVFTPHPAEMSRLLGKTVEEVQSNRIYLTSEAAIKWRKTIALKGAYTVIAAPDGRVRVSPFANAGLASAGTGDVLAGVVTGMAAQGLNLFDAATCGVYIHGQAGEIVREELGDTGMLASDLLPFLPLVIRQLKQV